MRLLEFFYRGVPIHVPTRATTTKRLLNYGQVSNLPSMLGIMLGIVLLVYIFSTIHTGLSKDNKETYDTSTATKPTKIRYRKNARFFL
jgi:hypothetical protein